MGNLTGKKILIFQQRRWAGNIGHFLAKKLQAEGCQLAALTFKNTTHEFICKQTEVKYDLILNNDEVMSRPRDYLQGDSHSLAEICDALGVDSIWPAVYTLRNHVKSYKDKYYYGFKQNVPDEGIIDYVMAVYKYINVFFDKFKPDLIIAPNFVALPHVMFNLFAQKQGVPMIAVTDSKVSGYCVFSQSYQDNKGAFYERVDALNNGQAESSNKDKAKQYIKDFREQFKKPVYTKNETQKTLIQKIRHELSPFYHSLRWYVNPPKNFIASTGISLDYRPPRILFRDHYCQKRYGKFAANFNYHPFDKIKQYVYFPLQFQPEEAIDVAAPYFSNQIETARQIAMSLPDDYTLIVKEHPHMVGLRPPSYLEKVTRTPNVKLIDYRIPSEAVLRKADLVVSPNSTTIAEAAYYNKPVVQLGDLGTTLKLPNVVKHTNMTTLANKIKEVLKFNLNTAEYERRLENFVAAVYDTGFDFDYYKTWEQGRGDKSLEPLWQAYKKEIENLLN